MHKLLKSLAQPQTYCIAQAQIVNGFETSHDAMTAHERRVS